jgi:hypothetical protein
MIDWFNTNEAQKFGTELALFFIERIPPQASAGKVKTLSKKKEVLGKMFFKIEHFKHQHTLNFYKKAKFGNAFQWTLKDAGYDSEFTDELTKEILLKLG